MKKSTIIALISVCIVFAAAAGGTILMLNSRNTPEYTLETARMYYDELNYEQAVIEFEGYLKNEPMDWEAWLILADSYGKKYGKEAEIEALNRAAEAVDSKTVNERLKALTETNG